MFPCNVPVKLNSQPYTKPMPAPLQHTVKLYERDKTKEGLHNQVIINFFVGLHIPSP